MSQIELYLILFAIVAIVAVAFRKFPAPTPLLLVIAGMLISFIPNIPAIVLDPDLVFNIFLPLLLYEASSYSSSWKELRKNLRPIVLLSIGHVLFITVLVAVTIHYLLPEFGWPLAFVLGAIISPPDDVAILSIAEKVQMPNRIVAILKGEAMLNDAAALTIFRFALLAVVTHQFFIVNAIGTFVIIVLAESLYGFALACTIGELRLRIHEPVLQMMISILTPFLAYIPAVKLGGSGVIATVVTGLVVGYRYWERYPADVRLTARSIWNTLGFAVQSILFLLVGLDLNNILARNSYIPTAKLFLYSSAVVLVVILGRFLWVYPAAYLPRFFIPSIRKKDPYPAWQFPFVISWAGMRGGISLAAALAVPFLPAVDGINPRDLLLFLVFSVITATLLLQGLSLPWLLKVLGMAQHGEKEKYHEHITELKAKRTMARAALRWLNQYKMQIKDDPQQLENVKLRIKEYKALIMQLRERLQDHNEALDHDPTLELKEEIFLLSQIIDVERTQLLNLWRTNRIDYVVKSKLELQLDLRAKHVEDLA